MTDFRALCAELVDDLALCDWPYKLKAVIRADIDRARAALAESEPEAPTDEELMSLFWEHENGLEEIWPEDWLAAARAVLARWGGPRR